MLVLKAAYPASLMDISSGSARQGGAAVQGDFEELVPHVPRKVFSVLAHAPGSTREAIADHGLLAPLRLPQCCQGLPGAGCQLQVEPRVRKGQVVAGDLLDALEAVLQGVAMDGQRLGGGV